MKSHPAQPPSGRRVDTAFAFQPRSHPPSVAATATSTEKLATPSAPPGFSATRAIIGCWPQCYRIIARKVIPFVYSPSSLATRPGPTSNLEFEISNPLCLWPSAFSLSKDPSPFRKDPSRKPEYPPLCQNIPPFPRISPPPFFTRNPLQGNYMHEHNLNPLKTLFVDYQPLAHSKTFHRVPALLAAGSASRPPPPGAFTGSSQSPHRPRCHLGKQLAPRHSALLKSPLQPAPLAPRRWSYPKSQI